MSAALVILPQVWATVATSPETGEPTKRKGPHRLALVPSAVVEPPQTDPVAPNQPELALYRRYTEAVLHRYSQMSLEAGRVPSLMGRELFQGNVSHAKVNGFDDVVHFVHDVGKCIGLLPPGQQYLIRRIAMQGYTFVETASMRGIGLSTVIRRYTEALDRLTARLLERKLMLPLFAQVPKEQKTESVEMLSRGRAKNNF